MLALALGRLAFWLGYFASRDPGAGGAPESPRPGRSGDPIVDILSARRARSDRAWILAGDLLTSSSRRVVLLDGVASLAALLGLAGTFVALRGVAGGVGTPGGAGDAAPLAGALGPALLGLAVFVLARVSLALFHSWENALRQEVAFALQIPLAPMAVRVDASAPDPERGPEPSSPPQVSEPLVRSAARSPSVPRGRGRRWAPPRRDGVFSSLRGGAVFAACLLGSILFHSAIFLLARRLDSSASGPVAREGDGVFQASLVAKRPDSEPPRQEIQREEPPAPPEPPVLPPPPVPAPPVPSPAVLKEPDVPRAEKPEPQVRETPTAVAKPIPETKPVLEREEPPPAPTPEPPPARPPSPAPPPERPPAPEPPAPAEPKVNETAVAKSDPPASPRYTEAPKASEKTPDPGPPPPAPAGQVRSTRPPADLPGSSEAPAATLGFGQKSAEPSESPAAPASTEGSGGISTVGDYRQFLSREMKAGAKEGQYVPNLRFGDNKPQENREIMRYFGMELIAYPADQKFYVYIEPEQGLFSRSNDFSYIRNFSTRVIFRNSPYFDSLRAEAARRAGVAASSLVVAQLLKPSSAAYIGWKERECARRAGVALEEVDACEATFVKTPFGVWIVRIDRLLLKSGQSIPIQDFEWARVATGKGGDS